MISFAFANNALCCPFCRPKLVWEEIEEPSINDEEFMTLFSRQVMEKKVPKKKVEKSTKSQVIIFLAVGFDTLLVNKTV